MKLIDTIEILSGGPGSGCQGPNCGRPETLKVDVEKLGKPKQEVPEGFTMPAPHEYLPAYGYHTEHTSHDYVPKFVMPPMSDPERGAVLIHESNKLATKLDTIREKLEYAEAVKSTGGRFLHLVKDSLDWLTAFQSAFWAKELLVGAFAAVSGTLKYVSSHPEQVHQAIEHGLITLQNVLHLATSIHAGGPGSGCHGPNCGRPSTGIEKRTQRKLGKLKNLPERETPLVPVVRLTRVHRQEGIKETTVKPVRQYHKSGLAWLKKASPLKGTFHQETNSPAARPWGGKSKMTAFFVSRPSDDRATAVQVLTNYGTDKASVLEIDLHQYDAIARTRLVEFKDFDTATKFLQKRYGIAKNFQLQKVESNDGDTDV